MRTFREWLEGLIGEALRPEIDPAVLAGYEHALRDEVRRVIQRVQNPDLRARLAHMLDCPIRDSRGQCRSFTDYIIAALVKNGLHHRFDLEAALGYVVEKLLMPTSETGEPRRTVFGGFEERPGDSLDFNPLQARFLRYLQWAINNIRKGKIARLAHASPYPPGTVSIGQGRARKDEPTVGISPDEIAARPSHDADLGEMVEDIETLLRQEEKTSPLPLVGLFRTIMAGERTDQQVQRFGDRNTRRGRKVIVDTLRDYAERSGNHRLLYLLGQFEGFQGNRPMPGTRRPASVPRPKLSEKERDYASLADVVGRLGRPAGSADFGKYRRRWLDYPPRDPSSGHRNRLEEVLARMVEDGVLRTRRTPVGATVYEPGPAFGQYRQEVEADG
jgi:hypothetical protein